MADLTALKAELDTDPLGRGYAGMTDAQAADDLNLLNRPAGTVPIDEIRSYWLLERKSQMALYGRLSVLAESATGSDPLGDAISLTLKHLCAARTMLSLLASGPLGSSIDVTDSRFDSLLDDLAAGQGAKVIAPGDKTAILGLADNKQSRADELNLGRVREGTIAQARAL